MNRHNRKYTALGLTFLLLAGIFLTAFPQGRTVFAAQEGELRFTVLHTNDEHSSLLPAPLTDFHPTLENPSLGGFSRLVSAVESIRQEKEKQGEPVLLLSAGDFLSGSPFSWLALAGSAPELSLMIELGYDAVTLGNHEYDYGADTLAAYLAAAGYPEASSRTPILAANSVFPDGHPLAGMGIKGTLLKKLDNGITVGFFGVIGKAAQKDAPDIDPVTFSELYEAARQAVAELKQGGADIIIALTHSGVADDRLLAREVKGINVIIGGHCHTALKEPLREGETVIAQTGSLLNNVGVLEFGFNRATGSLRLLNSESGRPYLLPLDFRLAGGSYLDEKLASYTAELNALVSSLSGGRFAQVSDTVAYSDFAMPAPEVLHSTPFGSFVADAMRLAAEDATGEKVHLALQGNGVIRGGVRPGTLPFSREQVSFYDLMSLVGLGKGPDGLPGNPVVSFYLTGEEIRRALETSVLLSQIFGDNYFLQVSGVRAVFDPGRAILFWVPVKKIPVPTGRAVLRAEIYTGAGLQGEEGYLPLSRGDTTLYHVVTDYYIASLLPMVGEMLPSFSLVMKDKNGNPAALDSLVVRSEGGELKVWQAVAWHMAGQPKGADGNPRIAEYYREPSLRIYSKKTIPLLVWPMLLLAVLVYAFVVLLRSRRKRAAAKKTA